jgi:DNA modification methylase
LSAIPDSLDQLRVPIDSVKPHGRNPRRGDVKEIVRSLRHHGQYRPIVVNSRTSEVLAGNHTLEAARALGWEDIAATFVDVDEDQAARIVLIDNRSNDLAGYDDAALTELLASLPDLEGTGYSPQDLTELLAAGGQTPGKDTEPKPRPKKPKARRGDVYVLGDHRLICGDATESADLERLLGREHPPLIYTDPPYGISYQAFDRKFDVLEGDDLRGEELRALVSGALELARRHQQAGGATYVWCSWRTYPEFVQALEAAGLKPSACIVWKKGRVGPGSAHYRPEHEFCLLCRPEVEGDHDLCLYCKGETWDGGRGQSDVWEVPRDTGYVHPTQKPVALAERALENSTRGGDLVLDMFGGSGSTLLACENLNRRARLLELDPAYVDVIVDRWERHTGRAAERKREKKR